MGPTIYRIASDVKFRLRCEPPSKPDKYLPARVLDENKFLWPECESPYCLLLRASLSISCSIVQLTIDTATSSSKRNDHCNPKRRQLFGSFTLLKTF
jgi:hypothetical protein